VPRARPTHPVIGSGPQVRQSSWSGALTGAVCDDELAGAEAASWRAPYIASARVRKLTQDFMSYTCLVKCSARVSNEHTVTSSHRQAEGVAVSGVLHPLSGATFIAFPCQAHVS
jgi:hypothetical protein